MVLGIYFIYFNYSGHKVHHNGITVRHNCVIIAIPSGYGHALLPKDSVQILARDKGDYLWIS